MIGILRRLNRPENLNLYDFQIVKDVYCRYEWFKEEYDNQDQLLATKIDPLSNKRFTLSGGTLIIYAPKRVTMNNIIFVFKLVIIVYKQIILVIIG